MIYFDPRLHIDVVTAGEIENLLMPLFESPTVLLNDAFPFALAAELLNKQLRVRAATGEEVETFLTVGDVPNPDGFSWPGDPASPTGRELDWQETQNAIVETDRSCYLWSGEVILKSGRGASGPFYAHRAAARSWAFATALGMPEHDIQEFQVVPYACVRHFAPALIEGGEAEFGRLNKFWISPVRSWGQVEQFTLPAADF